MSVETPQAPPTPAAPAAAAAAATPPPDPAAVPTQPQTVTIPLETLQTFTAIQTRLAKMEEESRVREQQAQQEQAAILAKKGEIENAFDLLRKSSERELAGARADKSMIEERAKRYALDGEVSRVLANHSLVPGAAEQLTVLLRTQFQVEPAGDSFAVRTPTFVSVSDHIAATLAKPEYAHFVRAQNPGGGTGGASPAGQTAPTQAANTAPPDLPKTLSDAVILTMKERKLNQADGRTDPRSGFGLRPAARQA